MDIKDRIIFLAKSKGLAIYRFETACGLSNGYLKNCKGKISVEKLAGILKAFPDVSLEWLLFGNGEMIKNPSTSSVSVVGDNNAVSNAVNNSNCKITHATDIQAQNTALREQVNKLQNELALLTKQNQRLTTKLLDYMEGENK